MEEGKRDEIQKNGVDYLIKQGYKKLSAKTFISDIDLERFLNKDFSNINRSRVLGFIQILEREYDVDLSDLRADYLSYESTHRVKKPETLFAETLVPNEKEWKKYLPLLAVILVVAGLVFFLFRPIIEVVQTPEPLTQQLEENKSIINEAQKNIEKLETNKSLTNENTLQKEENVLVVSSKSINDDLDLDKVVLQMMKERNLSSKEYDMTLDINSSKKVVKKLEEKQIKTVKNESVIISEVKKEVKKKKVTRGELYIKPLQKAWVGVIYLDNFTKKDFLIRTKLPLDSSRDQLIVIGHGKFKIYNKTYSVKFRGKGPIRFIYRDGELMEISKKEFKRTSAGVGW